MVGKFFFLNKDGNIYYSPYTEILKGSYISTNHKQHLRMNVVWSTLGITL